MIDYLNGIFAKAGIPLRPFDRETGISENDLNGIHVSLTYSKDLKSLLVSGVIMDIDDLYDPLFKKLEKKVLSMNAVDFLPEKFRIGIDVLELQVIISGLMGLDRHDDNLAAQAERLVKTAIFYATESQKMLFSEYEKMQNSCG